MTSLLERVRETSRIVAERAEYVRIDRERIADYCASLPLHRILSPELDPHSHYLGHGEGTVAFFVTLDAINFGSGYFPHLRKRPGMSGYFTIATSLAERYRAHGPFSAPELTGLTAADCARILGQEPANEPAAELMGL